jgi:hypothetical protein
MQKPFTGIPSKKTGVKGETIRNSEKHPKMPAAGTGTAIDAVRGG